MIKDSKGRTLIYDAFVKHGILTLVSVYYHYMDPPLAIIVNGKQATECGVNEGEPCRYFEVPVSEIPSSIQIDGQTYPIEVSILDTVAGSKGLAVATLFKDDHRFLGQMVDYYRKKGVTYFYLFYNGPQLPDGLPSGPDLHYGLWDFTYWNYFGVVHDIRDLGWRHAAQPAFLTMIQTKYLADHSWLGLVDIDEFVYPERGTLIETLERSSQDVVLVASHWAYLNKGNSVLYTLTADYKRSKAFYRGRYTGLVGIHGPKGSEMVDKMSEIKMFHIINFQQYGERKSLISPPRIIRGKVRIANNQALQSLD